MRRSLAIRLTVGAWIVIGTVVSRAQDPVPNGDFESWSAGEPADWITSQMVFAGSITQTSDAHSGNWAVQGNVVEFVPGFYAAGFVQTELYPGFPVSARWNALRGYYKLESSGNDGLYVTVIMYSNGVPIGAGAFLDSTTNSSYIGFEAPISYNQDLVPDSASIYITMYPGGASEFIHPGSVFKVDDLVFSPDTSSGGCPIAVSGDASGDGEVKSSDIIYLVNYVLKAGPAPVPCEAAGDANGDGEVKSSDIIYVVNYVLKGGDPPVEICDLIPGTWSCP